MRDLSGLPGADLVRQGLGDLEAERETVPALLVAIAGARLRRLRLPVKAVVWQDVELRLYRLLGKQKAATAYSRYNSLIRQIDSFALALEREEGAAARQGDAVES